MSLRVDAKGVFELGHNDVNGCSCGITSHQRLRQVGHHEAELDQTKQYLNMSQKKEDSCKSTVGFLLR